VSSSAAACIRCGGSLESGFILDNTYGGRAPSLWVEGAPERSFWQGVKLRAGASYWSPPSAAAATARSP
jgi:hypothetical protein